MQIDFHHGTTYVVARFAGFTHDEAATIAYASQYVDDATNDGILLFEGGPVYARIASAHKMLDYRNMEVLANHRAWIPFHFLPGNDGKAAGENPDAEFRRKIVCRPNSPVAQDVVRAAIAAADRPNGLHRLGVTMHVYADTWAHQGFAGIRDPINEVHEVLDADGVPDPSLAGRLGDFFGHLFDRAQSRLVGDVLPLGHGAALSYPDRPWLHWQYTNGDGEAVHRNNPMDFLEAAEHMYVAMQRFRRRDPHAAIAPMAEAQAEILNWMFRNERDDDGEVRHEAWLKMIREGGFGFPAVELSYVPKGPGSWKHAAIGCTEHQQDKDKAYPFEPAFLRSDWKRFHDALIEHRHTVLYHVLPDYGICAA